MNRRAASAAIGIVLAATAPGCSRGGGASGTGDSTVESPFVSIDPGTGSPTDRAIARAQERLRADFDNDSARLALAEAFLQKAREVGDPTLYLKADLLLKEAAKGRRDDPPVLIAQGALALAQHRFEDALSLGRRALTEAPLNSSALGVIVDALNELGRYKEALKATQDMVDAKPNLASLSRVSYARELRGDLDGAVAAMTQAVTAGTGSGENVAFVQVQLGNLLLTRGDVAGAEAAYAGADRSFPGYALASAGRARALIARADPAAAAEVLAKVVQVLPTAEHAIAHGDALLAAGRKPEAEEAYDLVDAIARLFRANGVNVDLELALFAADHTPGDKVVDQARSAVKERPSIQGYDALAWALFTAGEPGKAWTEARKALSTGSKDPALRYHVAAIADAAGEADQARRHLQVLLETNPRFSAVLAPRVAGLAAKYSLAVPPPPA